MDYGKNPPYSDTEAAVAPEFKTHCVTLSYADGGCNVNPKIVKAHRGDRLHFEKGGAPEGATIRIAFSDPAPFSAEIYNEGDPDIEVKRELPGLITYRCELIKDGKVIAVGDESGDFIPPDNVSRGATSPGGGVEPATGDRGASGN